MIPVAAAICALPPGSPERHWRLLAALGTFRSYPDGSVRVSHDALAAAAGLHPDTLRKARRELAASGVIAYQPGRGRGMYSAYLIPEKGGDMATPLFADYQPAEKGGRSPQKRGVGSSPDQGKRSGRYYTLKEVQPKDLPSDVPSPGPDPHRENRSRTMPKRPSHTPGPDDRPLWPAAVDGTEDEVITGQIVGGTSPARTAQTLVGEWVDWCQVKPSKRIIGQVAKYLGAMLNEDHIPYDVVRNGLRAWARSGTHPAALDSFVYTAGNAPQEQNRGRRWSGEATVAGGLAAIAAAERMVAGQ